VRFIALRAKGPIVIALDSIEFVEESDAGSDAKSVVHLKSGELIGVQETVDEIQSKIFGIIV